MDRLAWMHSFVRVVEHNGITRAAQQEHLSKAVVSKHLALLEEHLQVRLLNRTTRRLRLTEVGQVYYQRCVQILSDVAEADGMASSLHETPQGKLRLSAPVSFGHLHLAPALGDFLALYPEISIDLVLNDRFVDLLEEGFDLAVRISSRMPDSSLIARKLAPARLIACVSPDYAARHPLPQHPEELIRHDCLLYSYQSNPTQWRFQDQTGEERVVAVRGRLTVNNGDVLRQAALRGLGVALMPTFLVGRDVQAGTLVPLLNDYRLAEAGIHAVYPHNRHLSAKVRLFVEFLVNRFGQTPYWDQLGTPPKTAPFSASSPIPDGVQLKD